MSYAKLHSSILDSTIWLEPHHVVRVWIAMLAMKDQHGVVAASIPGLAVRARVELTECEEALAKFMSPDPYSRTKDFDGRRIEEVDGGWQLLNHVKYREIDSEDDRRRKDAERQQRFRARKALNELDGKPRTYLIVQQGTGFMKIGSSANPGSRLHDLQVASAVPLTIVHMVDGDFERELHTEFSDIHVNREWFMHTAQNQESVIARMTELAVTVTPRHASSRHTDTDTESQTEDLGRASGEIADSRACAIPPSPPPVALTARQKLNHDVWQEAKLAHDLERTRGPDKAARAWSAMPSGHAGMELLPARTKELLDEGDEAFVRAQYSHVINLRIAEAKELESLVFFIPSRLFDKESFDKARELSIKQAVEQARERKRRERRSTGQGDGPPQIRIVRDDDTPAGLEDV